MDKQLRAVALEFSPMHLPGNPPVGLCGQMMILRDFLNETFQNRNYPAH
ncbi:MAG TPA: hypothetical protein VMV70_06995 [Gallionella sp.]|nr:hypothetical protein [Gallionella sp.]